MSIEEKLFFLYLEYAGNACGSLVLLKGTRGLDYGVHGQPSNLCSSEYEDEISADFILQITKKVCLPHPSHLAIPLCIFC